MLGSAAVTIWCDVADEVREEFEDWHSHEHMPERLGIPGFRRGSRWSSEPAGSFFILYELDGPASLTGPAYLARLNDPTPWSRKMMPHHRNMVRSLCVLRAGWGGGLPRALATVRLAAGLTGLPKRKGLTGMHLLESQPMPGAPTTEQKIRGKDGEAAWALLVGGHEGAAVRAAADELGAGGIVGLYRLSYSLAAGDLA
jgi:hypothetical protein